MVSSWGPGTELETIFCIAGWAILVYKNLVNRLFIFAIACLFSVAAYCLAAWQYYIIFWVEQSVQSDKAMNLLFLRMLCHCICIMIFLGWYNLMPNLRKGLDKGFE